MAETRYVDTCRECGSPLDVVRCSMSTTWLVCPNCGSEEEHGIAVLIPGDDDFVLLSVLWKSATGVPSEVELAILRKFWTPFGAFTVDQLRERIGQDERIELTTLRWRDARPLVHLAQSIGLQPDYERTAPSAA